jgi:hypothetical protein
VAVFTCPRCEAGQLDSEKGKLDTCWYCSSHKPCYICPGCGMAVDAACLRKILAQKAAPAKKPEFRPENPEEDAL